MPLVAVRPEPSRSQRLEGLAHQKLVSDEVERLLAQWIDPATEAAARIPDRELG